MKRNRLPYPEHWLWLALAVALPARAALVPTEWPRQQALDVPAPGLVRVDLTPASFDSALPSRADFRLIDPSGHVVGYLLDEPPSPRGDPAPSSFTTRIEPGRTRVTVTTGTTEPLLELRLETPAPAFMRAAQIEISDDATHWTSLDRGVPLFRQWGADNTELSLGRHTAAFVRITIADGTETPLPVTSVMLRQAAGADPALIPVPARIVARGEYADETVLTVALDGKNIPVRRVTLETPEPLFTRWVSITTSEFDQGALRERASGGRTIYRLALEGATPRTQLEVPINVEPSTGQLLIHIRNGDSPPIAVDGVRVERGPLNMLFRAPVAGRYHLLSGNTRAVRPVYDLAQFSEEMHAANAVTVVPGPLESMPDYQPSTALAAPALPEVPLAGAPFDDHAWTIRRPIAFAQPGVEELELDLGCLGGARADFADLRVGHDGRQIPYVIEHTQLRRSLSLTPILVPDRDRPGFSVWRIDLPQAQLPLQRIVLTSPTTLFQRDFRAYEKVATPQGAPYENALGSETWHRLPVPGAPLQRGIEFTSRLRTRTVWVETDNGDNPAIELGPIQAVYPVVRVVFKVEDASGYTLEYGNPAANPPRYDLDLIASNLLATVRTQAQLAELAPLPGPAVTSTFAQRGILFWMALALVVVALLAIVGRLLPKPPAA